MLITTRCTVYSARYASIHECKKTIRSLKEHREIGRSLNLYKRSNFPIFNGPYVYYDVFLRFATSNVVFFNYFELSFDLPHFERAKDRKKVQNN